MKRMRYPAEFKAEAAKQVTERGHVVVDVSLITSKVFTIESEGTVT
jgi:transposase-like protein